MSKILRDSDPVTVQVTYAAKGKDEAQEVELIRFSNPVSASRFLSSIMKNPDVVKADRV